MLQQKVDFFQLRVYIFNHQDNDKASVSVQVKEKDLWIAILGCTNSNLLLVIVYNCSLIRLA